MLMSTVVSAQYPTTDHFDAVGLNGWTQVSGSTANAGWHSPTDICTNIAGDYVDKDYYSWESPALDHSSCTDVDVTFSVSFSIRNNDAVYFCWVDGGWTCVEIASSGAWVINLPSTTTKYSLDLDAAGNGNTASKFTHFDYVTTACNIPLPVDFIDMYVTCVSIEWVTSTEINNDYFTLQHSYKADVWRDIHTQQGGGNLNTPSLYKYDGEVMSGYYRLIQTDYNGSSNLLSTKYISCLEVYGEPSVIYNMLGQEVKRYTLGYLILVYPDGTVQKNMFETREEWNKYLH